LTNRTRNWTYSRSTAYNEVEQHDKKTVEMVVYSGQALPEVLSVLSTLQGLRKCDLRG